MIYVIKASVSFYNMSISVGCWMSLRDTSLMQRNVHVKGVPRQPATAQAAELWVTENSDSRSWCPKMLKCFVQFIIPKYATIYEY